MQGYPIQPFLPIYHAGRMIIFPVGETKGTFVKPLRAPSDDDYDFEKPLKLLSERWSLTTLEDFNVIDWPLYNGAAALTGYKSGIIVLDFDPESMPIFEELYNTGKLNGCAIACTPRNGRHIYVKYSDALENILTCSKSTFMRGKLQDIDIRANGGIIYLPGTIFLNKKGVYTQYTWLKGHSLKVRGREILNLLSSEVLLSDLFNFKYPGKDKVYCAFRKRGYKFVDCKGWIPDKGSYEKRDTKTRLQINKFNFEEESKDIHPPLSDGTIELLLSMLNKKRCDDYGTWFKIGTAIYNETSRRTKTIDSHHDQLPDTGKDVFDRWSQLSPNYNYEGVCKLWNWLESHETKKFTFGTVRLWAEQDSPELYSAFKASYIKSSWPDIYLEDGGKARFVFKALEGSLFYLSFDPKDKEECWLYFDQKTKLWVTRPSSMLTDMIGKILVSELAKIKREINAVEDKKERKRRLKQLQKAELSCDKLSTKKAIIETLKPMMYHPELSSIFGLIPYEIAISEGMIWNQKEGKMKPRKSSDFYIEEVPRKGGARPDHPNVISYMQSIFPDEVEYEYMHRKLGYFSTGELPDRDTSFWTGKGKNGKSMLAETMALCLGPLAGDAPESIIMQTHGNEDVKQPQMVELITKRFVLISETTAGGKINNAKFNRINGGDRLVFRLLQSNKMIKKRATAKLIVCTNHLPVIDHTDGAVIDRYYTEPFNTSFVINPNPDNPNERKRDPSVVKWIQSSIPDESGYSGLDYFFAWVMEGAKKYYQDPSYIFTRIPPRFLAHKQKFLKKINSSLSFIEEHIVPSIGETSKIKDLYTKYKEEVEKPDSCKAFTKTLKDRFPENDFPTKDGYKYIADVALRKEHEKTQS